MIGVDAVEEEGVDIVVAVVVEEDIRGIGRHTTLTTTVRDESRPLKGG
jgi:hypothetical protein